MNIFKLPIKFEGIPFCRKDGEIKFLLVKRIPEDGGFWQPITGTLESSESLTECIYREFEEEININKNQIISVTDMFYQFTWVKNKDTQISEYVFGVELPDTIDIKLGNEHDDYRWCSYDEAQKTLEKDNNKKAFMEFKSRFISPIEP